jgi:Smg protein
MKETVLDVIMYLFENYLDDDNATETDRDSLIVELEAAGFPEVEVGKAFDWLESLAESDERTENVLHSDASMRVFAEREAARLDVECRGFLLYLGNVGILSAAQREVVIDRIMALDSDDIDLDQVKWIVLMVLFNQPGQELAYARMENLVFAESIGAMH